MSTQPKIRFRCQKCGKGMSIAAEYAGKKGKCKCGAVVRIPMVSEFEKIQKIPEPVLIPIEEPPQPVLIPIDETPLQKETLVEKPNFPRFCIHCGKPLGIPADYTGGQFKCLSCGASIAAIASVPVTPTVSRTKTFSGKFRKVKIKPLRNFGNYRGQGTIEVSDDSLRIYGRHVLSMGARWGIGLALFFGFLILTLGMFAPGIIPLYLIMEYVWLKREDIKVPFSNVIHYVSSPKKSLVGIDFHGDKYCRPVVLRSENWQELLAMLRQKMPDRDASRI